MRQVIPYRCRPSFLLFFRIARPSRISFGHDNSPLADGAAGTRYRAPRATRPQKPLWTRSLLSMDQGNRKSAPSYTCQDLQYCTCSITQRLHPTFIQQKHKEDRHICSPSSSSSSSSIHPSDPTPSPSRIRFLSRIFPYSSGMYGQPEKSKPDGRPPTGPLSSESAHRKRGHHRRGAGTFVACPIKPLPILLAKSPRLGGLAGLDRS